MYDLTKKKTFSIWNEHIDFCITDQSAIENHWHPFLMFEDKEGVVHYSKVRCYETYDQELGHNIVVYDFVFDYANKHIEENNVSRLEIAMTPYLYSTRDTVFEEDDIPNMCLVFYKKSGARYSFNVTMYYLFEKAIELNDLAFFDQTNDGFDMLDFTYQKLGEAGRETWRVHNFIEEKVVITEEERVERKLSAGSSNVQRHAFLDDYDDVKESYWVNDSVICYTIMLPFTCEMIGYVELTPWTKNIAYYIFEE